MTQSKSQVCQRCGHESPLCRFCERIDPILGGQVNGAYYCHTFVPVSERPTCYMAETYELAFGTPSPRVIR